LAVVPRRAAAQAWFSLPDGGTAMTVVEVWLVQMSTTNQAAAYTIAQ